MGVGKFIVPVKNPVLGEKEITSNGTYTASSEGLDGYSTVTVSVEGGSEPSTSSQNIFTGATLPLTYKDNTHTTENIYVYKSPTHNITIAGLEGRATITGNGTREVTASFDVTSAVSSLKNFTITCVKGTESVVYTGMHAHYGTTCTGILTFAYKNITKDGSEGTIGTNYLFIETASNTLPLTSSSGLWNGIYSHQLLNVLIGNYSGTTIGNYFLGWCYAFNQPLTIPAGVSSIGTYFLAYCYAFNHPIDLRNVSSIGNYFLAYCSAFNQPIDLRNVSSIGSNFLYYCCSFNQPLTIPAGVSSIGSNFLAYCYAFNQPLDLSNVKTIVSNFLYYCYAFNQPLDLSNVKTMGNYFLSYCYSFNQPLTIPAGVSSIGGNFLYKCYALSTIIWETTTCPTDINSLSQDLNTKPNATYGAGIVIYGSKSSNLKTALADITSNPYRKLIDGEA